MQDTKTREKQEKKPPIYLSANLNAKLNATPILNAKPPNFLKQYCKQFLSIPQNTHLKRKTKLRSPATFPRIPTLSSNTPHKELNTINCIILNTLYRCELK